MTWLPQLTMDTLILKNTPFKRRVSIMKVLLMSLNSMMTEKETFHVSMWSTTVKMSIISRKGSMEQRSTNTAM
jgi:hypothetical protein